MKIGKLRWLALVAVLAIVAAACGGDDDSVTTTTGATTTQAPGTTTAPATTSGPVTGLSGLKVIDDLTFTVELEVADPQWPLQLSYPAFYPMPKDATTDPDSWQQAPVGNGPFKIDGTWEHDVQIKVVPYEGYAGAEKPKISSLTYKIFADPDSYYDAIEAGDLDMLDTLGAGQLEAAKAKYEPQGRYKETQVASYNYLGFPFYDFEGNVAPWRDPEHGKEIRQAMSMAIDKQAIIDSVFAGNRKVGDSVISAVLPGYREGACPNWQFNPTEAKAKFEAAGGPALFEAWGAVNIWHNTSTSHAQWTKAVADQWAENLGIEAVFTQLPFSQYLELLKLKQMDGLFRLGWGMDYPSPQNFLEPLFHSEKFADAGGSNNAFYSNPEFDKLIAQGNEAAVDGLDAAIPFYQQAEDLLCDDVPVIPMFFGKNAFVWSDNVEGVYIDAFGDYNTLEITGGDVSAAIGEPAYLFPTNSEESEGIAVLRALFDGLVEFDPQTTELRMAVAKSIESEDGKTWTVTLNDGWTFHNGEPVTASSFVDAWNYGANTANAQRNAGYYSNIVGYAALNPE